MCLPPFFSIHLTSPATMSNSSSSSHARWQVAARWKQGWKKAWRGWDDSTTAEPAAPELIPVERHVVFHPFALEVCLALSSLHQKVLLRLHAHDPSSNTPHSGSASKRRKSGSRRPYTECKITCNKPWSSLRGDRRKRSLSKPHQR